MGEDQGIPIPSSDPLLEETQLITSATAGHTPAPQGHADRGSARKIRSLSLLPSLLGGNRALPGFGVHKTATHKQSKESDYLNPAGMRANSCIKLQIYLWNVGPPLPASRGKSKRSLEGMVCTQSLREGKGGKATVLLPWDTLPSSPLAFFSSFSHDYPTVTNKLRGENSSSHKLGFAFGNSVLSQWFRVFIHFAKLSKLRIPYWSIRT